MSRSKWSYGAVVVVMALTLAACSSSSKSSSSSGTTAATSSTGAAGSSGSAGSTSASQTPKGTPLEVMDMTSFGSPGQPAEPEVPASIRARLAAINAAGGIQGRPVKLIFCPDNGDPNQSRTCANQAVSNPNVVATLFVFSNNDNVTVPIFESAGLPEIAIDPQGSTDLNCSVCFPMWGGGYSDTVGLGTLLHTYEGVNKIDMEIPTVPVAQAEMSAAKNGFLAINPSGTVKTQFVPLTVANYAPYVEATRGYEGTALFTGGSQLAAWIKQASSLGIKMKWGVLGISVTPPTPQPGGQ